MSNSQRQLAVLMRQTYQNGKDSAHSTKKQLLSSRMHGDSVHCM